jgi:hypothetical protein
MFSIAMLRWDNGSVPRGGTGRIGGCVVPVFPTWGGLTQAYSNPSRAPHAPLPILPDARRTPLTFRR